MAKGVPPFNMAKASPPPFFRRGKTSHAPPPTPVLFVAPPFPVISDQSLNTRREFTSGRLELQKIGKIGCKGLGKTV